MARATTTHLACLLVAGGAQGCSLLFPLQPDRDAASGAEPDAVVDAPLDAGNDAEIDAPLDAGSDADIDAPLDSGNDAEIDAGLDSGCDPAACPQAPTCAALRDMCPCAASGVHVLDPDGDKAGPFDAYCDMDSAGGGWMLVGRSVRGAEPGTFGWGVDRGTVAVEGEPYSLDIVSRGFAPTELLVGSHDDGMTWGPNVYEIPVPADFLSTSANTAVDVAGGVVVVAGDCVPAFDPLWMLRHVGHTSSKTGFFFRDLSDFASTSGLNQGGWDLAQSSCDRSGLLHSMPGMLFVR